MITSEEMRELEKKAIEDGLSREEMMENAGKGAADYIKENYDLEKNYVIVFAGHGNNGGDGLVAARYLAEHCPVTVLIADKELSELTQKNLEKLQGEVNIREISELNMDRIRINGSHIILIDALLGIGVKGELRDPYESIVEAYNEIDAQKISLDVPTGMNPDTGEEVELSADFDKILTFHELKKGLEKYKDKTEVIDIGL